MVSREKALKQLKLLEKHGKNHRLAAQGWDKDWKSLIATILSARTRDEKTIEVCKVLFGKYDSIEKLSKASLQDIEKTIRQINFYRNKSKLVLKCANFLKDNYSNVPLDYSKLREIPGVGDKTANVFLAENNLDAIGVDTHVNYVSNKLGWTKNKSSEKIEKDLRKLFPKNYWNKVNVTLVRFGKTYTSRKKKDEILDEIKKS